MVLFCPLYRADSICGGVIILSSSSIQLDLTGLVAREMKGCLFFICNNFFVISFFLSLPPSTMLEQYRNFWSGQA